MAGWENDIGFSKNFDFTEADNQSPSESNGLVNNGQLWIGSTALNAGSTHINVGALTSPNASVSIGYATPNITLQAGAAVATTYTEDSGSATPAANNLNVLGQQAGSTPVMFTIGSGSTINIEDRTWTTSIVVDASATVGLRGTFQTITAALAAATSGQTIFIRPGTYVENITMVAGVNLQGYDASGNNSSTVINGTITCTYTGTCTISGLTLTAGNANNFSLTGTNATVLNVFNCNIIQNATVATQYIISCTNNNADISFVKCVGSMTNEGSFANITQSSDILLQYCYFPVSETAVSNSVFSTITNSACLFHYCTIETPFVLDNTTATINYSEIGRNVLTSPAPIAMTNGSIVRISYSRIKGTQTVSALITVDATSNLFIGNTTFTGTFAAGVNLITVAGGGVLGYNSLTTDTGLGVTDPLPSPTNSVGVNVLSTVAIKGGLSINTTSVSSSPYVVLVTDQVLLVDTSSARTIQPQGTAPLNGAVYRIKDSTGSAATNNITITPSGGFLIDGQASYVINTNYGSVDIINDGSNYYTL